MHHIWKNKNGVFTEIKERIIKDIKIFENNIKQVNAFPLSEDEQEVIELATMYYKDTESFLSKNDYYTAFASINYAHGLLDAILKLHGKK